MEEIERSMEQELHHPEREPREPESKPVAAPAVRDITKKVFDGLGLPFSPDGNNLVPIAMPTAGTFKVIDESRFAFGRKDPLQFRDVPQQYRPHWNFRGEKGRLGTGGDPRRPQGRHTPLRSGCNQRALFPERRLFSKGRRWRSALPQSHFVPTQLALAG